MHDVSACRHIDPAACPDVSETHPVTDTSRHTFVLVRDPTRQELAATTSRQLRRADDFLDAARYMVTAGLHPKASQTTLRLAAVFAARMTRSSRGHFPFSADATARELGLSRRAVMYHAQYLRELGLIAYVEHGSKTNVLRTRRGAAWQPGDGYRGTATLFAAVAPRLWDEANGRRLEGTGYTSRIIGVTEAGRARAVEDARRKASSRRASQRTSCTPSVVVPQDHSQLKVVGGEKYTSRKRATCPKNTPHTTTTARPRVSPAQCARGIAVAEQLMSEVWWLHRGCARRLAHALRPLITAGWTWQSLASELRTWGVPGCLRDPAAYVWHELERRRRLGDLPETTPSAQPDVDDHGIRHTVMLRERQERHSLTWQHYAQHIRPVLRQRLADARQSVVPAPRRRPTPHRPQIRESEEAFARSLPLQSWGGGVSPLEVYRARSYRLPVPERRAASEADRGWLEQLRDQHRAERACAALLIELEDWARANQHAHGGEIHLEGTKATTRHRSGPVAFTIPARQDHPCPIPHPPESVT